MTTGSDHPASEPTASEPKASSPTASASLLSGPDATQPATRQPWLRWIYLALAIAGGVLPWLANLDFIRSHGAAFDLGLFVQLANANPAAQSLSRDLAIGATAVSIWMVSEARRLRLKGLGWVLLSCVTIAFAFGCPLFLYLRERRLQELAAQRH